MAPYASLPPKWDIYLSSRSKSFRKGFKGREKKLKCEHHVEFLTAGREISAREAINCVASLSRERWGDASRAFHSKQFCEFHAQLADLLVPEGRASAVVMLLDGAAVAAGYDFVCGSRVFGFQGGWKESLARLAIGKIMLGYQFQCAINQGLSTYDFLAGDAGYKSDWATGQRQLLDLEVINPKSFRGRTFDILRRGRNVLSNVECVAPGAFTDHV